MCKVPDINKLMDFENGQLNEDEVAELFQDLIDSGLVWKLQGFYGRTARDLVESGRCTLPVEEEE